MPSEETFTVMREMMVVWYVPLNNYYKLLWIKYFWKPQQSFCDTANNGALKQLVNTNNEVINSSKIQFSLF